MPVIFIFLFVTGINVSTVTLYPLTDTATFDPFFISTSFPQPVVSNEITNNELRHITILFFFIYIPPVHIK
jgi:hypothetical protein